MASLDQTGTLLANSRALQRLTTLVFELWFDDQLVAPQLIIESTDMLITLKTTYDEAFWKCSPGHQLPHDVIQYLFAHQPGKVIDFYTDATTDQLAWVKE